MDETTYYKMAEHITLLKCPECGCIETTEDDGMPERDSFKYDRDDNEVEYVTCMCGCKFVDEK